MQTTRTLGFLLLIALAGFATWTIWPRPEIAPPDAAAAGGAARHAAGESAEAEAVAEAEAAAAAGATAVEATDREVAANALGAPVVASAAVLTGRVVDESGQPVAAATVLGWSRSTRWRELSRRGATGPAAAEAEHKETTTDAQGRFRLPAEQVTGAIFLRVQARGYRVFDRNVPRPTPEQGTGTVVAAAEGETDIGTVTLKRGAIVGGFVVDAAGVGIAGARVTREGTPQNGIDEAAAGLGLSDLGDFDFGDFGPTDGVSDLDFGESEAPGAVIVRDLFGRASVTDADGRFELPHCEAGPFALRVRHTEHPSTRRTGLMVAAGVTLPDVVITMSPGAVIRGRLRDVPEGTRSLRVLASTVRQNTGATESPFGEIGAQMAEMVSEFGGPGERTCELAADQTFELRGLHPGRTYRVWAAQGGRGYVGTTACSQRLEVVAPSDGVELRYDPGVTVTFQVVDATSGAAVEYLWVQDQLRGGGGMADMMALAPRPGAAASRTYPEGRVTLASLRPKKSQTLSLTIKATGFLPLERGDVVLPLVGSLDLGILRLEPAPVLDVVVRAADTGAPIEDAAVRVVAVEAAPERGDGNPFLAMARRAQRESGPSAGRTAADGHCVVNVPRAAAFTISVTSKEHAPYTSATQAPPESRTTHEVLLQRGGTVDVFAVSASGDSGAAVAGVRIQHRTPAGDRDSQVVSRDGRAMFAHLAPGEHQFRIGDRGAGADLAAMAAQFGGERSTAEEPGWQTVSVVDGGRAELRLTVDPGASLRGIVRENGQPLAGARLSFVKGEGSGGAGRSVEGLATMMAEMGGQEGRSGRSADDGSYQLKGLVAGSHRVRVTAKGRAMPAVITVQLQPGENVLDLALDVAIVRGKVLGPDGQPVAGASVTVVEQRPRGAAGDPLEAAFGETMSGMDLAGLAGGARSAKTADDGTFELRGVQPGTPVAVRAAAKTFAAAASTTFELAPNGTRDDVVIQLLAAGKVRVTVNDAAPFVSARARWLDANGEPDASVPPVMQLLGKGSGTLTGLRAGRWRVDLIQPTGGTPQQRLVDVVAGETATVAF